jgi:hypothetical protein
MIKASEQSFDLTAYSVQHRELWDDVVRTSKNGTFLHLRDYMDYHAHRFDEQSVLVLKKGKPVAAFPANRVGARMVSHGGLTYGGLLYGPGFHAVEVLELFRLLSEYYLAMGVEEILYKPVPHIFHSYPAEEDLYALFRLNARLFRRDISSAVQLSGRIKFSDSRKCTIRKSANRGTEIREGEFFGAFHKLLAKGVAKYGIEPVHSTRELHLLKERFPDRIRLFGAFDQGELLAGALVYDFGKVVHSQYLATSDQGRKTGALDFVLAHLIEDAFAGRHYFNFGISTEQDGLYLNESLIFQKEGFGARGVVHDFYLWTLQ